MSALPLTPRWGWKPQLSRNQLVRPDHDLLAVLPLDGDRLVGDLEAPLVDREIARTVLVFSASKASRSLSESRLRVRRTISAKTWHAAYAPAD